MLIWFLTIIPVGIPLCAIIGLMYGIKNKDTIFTKCSAVALFVGIACIVYTLLVIKSTYIKIFTKYVNKRLSINIGKQTKGVWI